MDILLLVKSFLGLVVILAILVFVLLKGTKKKKSVEKAKPVKREVKRDEPVSLQKLLAVIKNKKSTAKELSEALDKIIKYHGTIHPKLGVRAHPDFNIYGEILLRVCHHPNTNKDIILNFDRALEAKNEAYKKEINDFLTKGLETRGV